AQRRLVRADLTIGVLERTQPRAAALINLVYALIGLFLFWKILVWAWPDILQSYAGGEFSGVQGVYEIPVWPFKLALIVGAAFGMVQFARLAIEELLILGATRVHRLADGSTENVVRSLLIGALFLAVVIGFIAFLLVVNPRPIQVGFYSLVAMLVLVLLGMPIALGLMCVAYLGIWVIRSSEQLAINTLGLAASTGVGTYEFGVIPLFIMMGLVLEKADVGRDAFQVA